MMRRNLSWVLIIGFVTMSSGAAYGGDESASVYVVHGIPGEDLGPLPVDISVNGECALAGFTFGEIVGPLPLAEGEYSVSIALADENTPCANDPIIQADVGLLAGTSYSVVAYLTADGTPTAGVFENDLSATARGRARLIVQHTAAAPEVDVTVQRGGPNSPALLITDFANGEQAAAEVRPGDWDVSIAPAGSAEAVFGPATVTLSPFAIYLIYAVGSPADDTFTLLIKAVE